MKKSSLIIAACSLVVVMNVNAANSGVANSKAVCQSNPTQCSNAKAQAKKEAQSAKAACQSNPTQCNNAKSKAKSAMSQ